MKYRCRNNVAPFLWKTNPFLDIIIHIEQYYKIMHKYKMAREYFVHYNVGWGVHVYIFTLFGNKLAVQYYLIRIYLQPLSC